ncbi:hypothetical protein [Vibrio owensii]|uniref:hypothetical protein n=1 Tax=Vibrio owensii TaxID=696485 RepID=UPI0018F1966C|nr:hypothetical protein [Vibrio owensii]
MERDRSRVNKVVDLIRPNDPLAPIRLIAEWQTLEDLSPYKQTYSFGEQTLTAVRTNGLKGNRKKLGVVCSRCNQDTELFPDLFWITPSDLKQGKCPCTCRSNYMWSTKQYTILIEREIQRRGDEQVYGFGGFVEEPERKVTNKTKIWFAYKETKKHVVTKNDKRWEPSINNYLTKTATDELSYRKRSSARLSCSDEEWTNKFRENGAVHTQGSVKRLLNEHGLLERNSNGNALLEVYCPVCYDDEYVRDCGSARTFHSTCANLTEGKICCRCSTNYNWNEVERKYQLNRAAKIKNAEITSFNLTVNLNESKIDWICQDGHLNSNANACNFLHKKDIKCKVCYDVGMSSHTQFSGYYPAYIDEPDTVYLLEFKHKTTGEEFIKVGRSFNMGQRIKQYEHKFQSILIADPELWKFSDSHQGCYIIETLIKNKFIDHRTSIHQKPSYETFKHYVLRDIVSFAESLSNSPNLKLREDYLTVLKTLTS